MLSRRTVIDQIEIRPQEGTVQLRLAKQILDGDQVISQQWHRTAFDASADVDGQLAVVNAHLEKMGEATVAEWQSVKDHVALTRTSLADMVAAEAAKVVK